MACVSMNEGCLLVFAGGKELSLDHNVALHVMLLDSHGDHMITDVFYLICLLAPAARLRPWISKS